MITLIATVLFCLGWRIVTDEGQVLYPIRKFFEDCVTDLEHFEVKAENNPHSYELTKWKLFIFMNKVGVFVGTPFVLCITCMASIWGVTVFYFINGLSVELIPAIIFNSVAASFIQTFIWKLYGKLD